MRIAHAQNTLIKPPRAELQKTLVDCVKNDDSVSSISSLEGMPSPAAQPCAKQRMLELIDVGLKSEAFPIMEAGSPLPPVSQPADGAPPIPWYATMRLGPGGSIGLIGNTVANGRQALAYNVTPMEFIFSLGRLSQGPGYYGDGLNPLFSLALQANIGGALSSTARDDSRAEVMSQSWVQVNLLLPAVRAVRPFLGMGLTRVYGSYFESLAPAHYVKAERWGANYNFGLRMRMGDPEGKIFQKELLLELRRYPRSPLPQFAVGNPWSLVTGVFFNFNPSSNN